MENSLPWALVFAGVAIAIVVEIQLNSCTSFRSRSLPSDLLSTPIMAGGLVRLYFDKKKGLSEGERT